jgi:hypothetical protein
MGKKRLPQTNWNFLRESGRLRGAMCAVIDMYELDEKVIAKELDIVPYALSCYLRGKTPSICNYDIIRLAAHLGLEVDLDINPGPQSKYLTPAAPAL